MIHILRNAILLLIAQMILGAASFSQIINTEHKPPSLVFRDEGGKVVSSVPLETDHAALVLAMSVSRAANTAYVLNALGKSSARSVSAVNLDTLHVDRVIDIGPGAKTRMKVSSDGHRLFCYKHSEPVDEAAAANSIVVIDTASNSLIRRVGLIHNPHIELPDAKFIETGLSPTSNGDYLIVGVVGFHHANAPAWQRMVIMPVESPDTALVLSPRFPHLAGFQTSPNGKFLFMGSRDKDKAEVVYIVNLDKRTSASRDIEDPPTREDRLGYFLAGAPPSGLEPKQGVWVFTRTGLRFLSEDGELGKEVPLPRQDHVAALLSLDRTKLFMAVPNASDNTGTLEVINLKEGTSSSHVLSESPRWLMRLGSAGGLWVVGHQEMRPVSENGELGDHAIALNKSKKTDPNDTEGMDTVLNGDAGQAITLGEARAAMLITNKKGGTQHRVALLDLKQFQVDGVVTISRQKFSESSTGRFLGALGEAAAAGAMEGVASGLSGAPTNLFTPGGVAGGPSNEALTAQPDGKALYVLNLDTHELSAIDVTTATVTNRIEMDHSVTAIHVARDHKHLYGVGPGVIQTISLDPLQSTN